MESEFSLLGEVLVIGSLFLLAVGYFASDKDHLLSPCRRASDFCVDFSNEIATVLSNES